MENKIVLGGALQDAFSKYHAKNREKYETIENSVLELDKKLEDMGTTGSNTVIEMSNPLTTKPLEYGYFKLSNNVSNLLANTSIPFDVVDGGNMELNQNGEVLLKAGKTYKILAGAFITCNDTKIAIGLRIVDAETKEFLIGGAKVPVTHTTAYSGNDIMGILTPEKDMYIGVQSVYDIALVNSVYTNLVVEEVRDNVVNQYGGFETGVLFDGVANSIGDYSLAESLEDYSLLIVQTSVNYDVNEKYAIKNNIIPVSDIVYGKRNQFLYDREHLLNEARTGCGLFYSFKDRNTLSINHISNDGGYVDSVQVSKITGIKGQIPSLLIGGKF